MKKSSPTQLKATFLLFLFVFDLFRPYVLSASTSNGNSASGDGPVASSASNYVDPFTGDFHYSVPLMVVPGPNGESVDITAGYHGGGIRMDEPASWIGLGWNYNPGEISRSAIGVPDDANGDVLEYTNLKDLVNSYDADKVEPQKIYGPLYYSNFKDVPGTYDPITKKSFDVYTHNAPSNTTDIMSLPFQMPAYDRFMVSGPGISGRIRPISYGVNNLTTSVSVMYNYAPYGGGYNSIKSNPQFIFENSTAFNYNPPVASNFNVYSSSYYDGTNNRIIQGNYVKYFTDDQINLTGSSSILYDNSTHTGFLDYRIITSGSRRQSGDFIGGFQVTNPNGITYHYSLPVYSDNERSLSFGLKEDGSGDPDFGKSIQINRKTYKYPNSWKLTAVTGSDYEDTNNNHVVDQGDNGYWIAYNYTLWTNSFNWCSSFFSYKQDISISGAPSLDPLVRTSSGDFNPTGIYSPKGSVVIKANEVYYLDNIKTSTHTAFFVKDLRMDEHSYDHILNSSNKPKPSLKLNKIILVRNEDAGLFANGGSFPSNSNFDLANCNTSSSASPSLVHIGTYNAHKTAIDNKTLKAVSFSTDYSLCQKMPNNINNSFSVSYTTFTAHRPGATVTGEIPVFDNAFLSDNFYATPSSSSYASSNGGKLTLNEILTYENGNAKVFPSYKFNYGNNLDYDQNKVDLFGFYNSDYSPGSSHYNYSGTGTDAWSLTKVTTPLGGEINVTYDPDIYNSCYSNKYQSGLSLEPPSYIYLISNAENACTGTTQEIFYPIDRNFTVMEQDFFLASVGAELFVPIRTRCVGTSLWQYGYVTGTINSINNGNNNTYNFNFTGSFSITGAAGPNAYSCAGNTLVWSNPTVCSHYNTSAYLPQTQYEYIPRELGYGYISVPTSAAYGGGIRVRQIEIKDPQANQSYLQKYTYYSGICTANPDRVMIKNHGIYLNNASSDVFAEAPMVGYEYVEVKTVVGSNTQTNGETVYEYPVQSTLPDYRISDNSSTNSFILLGSSTNCCSSGNAHLQYPIRNYKITLNTGNISLLGKPSKISSYDNQGALVAYTAYNYKTSNPIGESFSNMNDYNEPCFTRGTIGIPMFYKCCICPQACSNICEASSSSCGSAINTQGYALYTGINDCTTFLYSTETYKDGITIKQTITERDPYTGAPTKTLTEDPTQGAFLNTTEFAYTRLSGGSPVYSSMGLKGCSGCIGNQNNLTNVSETRTIKYPLTLTTGGSLVPDLINPGLLIGGTKNTFTNSIPYRTLSSGYFTNSNQSKLFWKPYESYQLSVDANTLETAGSLTWRKTSEATSYNSSNQGLLEAKGLNGRCASAIKMGYNNQYKIADISDASLDCFAFSSFEDGPNMGNSTYFGGEINGAGEQKQAPFTLLTMTFPFNLTITLNPHSGNYIAKVPASGYGPTFVTRNFEKNRTYRASVWMNAVSATNSELKATLDGTFTNTGSHSPVVVTKSITDASNITVGQWKLVTIDITVPADYTATSGSLSQNDLRFFVQNNDASLPVYIDDFSVHPIDAPITGYVYNATTGWLTATLDNENFGTYYSYDQAGRVIKVSKETKNGVKKISETAYHFGRP